MDIFTLAKNMQRFDIERNVEIAILSNQDAAIKANQNQLIDGEDMFGREIKPNYANDNYARFKNRRNNRAGFGTPDLNLTGKLFNGMFMEIKGDDVNIESKDPKFNFPSIEQYGSDVWGVQENNLKSIRYTNTSEFIKLFDQQVFR